MYTPTPKLCVCVTLLASNQYVYIISKGHLISSSNELEHTAKLTISSDLRVHILYLYISTRVHLLYIYIYIYILTYNLSCIRAHSKTNNFQRPKSDLNITSEPRLGS